MPITDYYVTTDAMGSVMAVLDEAGNVLERRSYDAFGEATYMLPDGTVVPDSPTGVDIGFQGQLMDELTGMYQMGYRWYSPILGRWVSRDPIGLEGGVSLMAFVGNGPQVYSDAFGLFYEWWLNFRSQLRQKILLRDMNWEEWRKKLQASAGELEDKLKRLCPDQDESSDGGIVAQVRQCCSRASCLEQAEIIAQELVMAASDVGAYQIINGRSRPIISDNLLVGAFAKNGGDISSDMKFGYGLTCAGWNSLMAGRVVSALEPYRARGQLCFRFANASKGSFIEGDGIFNSLLNFLSSDYHEWALIYPTSAVGVYSTSNCITIDPWQSGGADLVPVSPYVPEKVSIYWGR